MGNTRGQTKKQINKLQRN